MARRIAVVALAATLTVPSGCATGRGWHGGEWGAAMMGAMVVGGLVFGRGLMHGGGTHHGAAAPDADRFNPARLLEQRELLELTGEQVDGLESLRDDVTEGRRTPENAARAAYELLRPVQRAAISGEARSPDRNRPRPLHNRH